MMIELILPQQLAIISHTSATNPIKSSNLSTYQKYFFRTITLRIWVSYPIFFPVPVNCPYAGHLPSFLDQPDLGNYERVVFNPPLPPHPPLPQLFTFVRFSSKTGVTRITPEQPLKNSNLAKLSMKNVNQERERLHLNANKSLSSNPDLKLLLRYRKSSYRLT